MERNRRTLENGSLWQKSYATEANLWRPSDDFSGQIKQRLIRFFEIVCMYSCKFILGHAYGCICHNNIKLPFVARGMSRMWFIWWPAIYQLSVVLNRNLPKAVKWCLWRHIFVLFMLKWCPDRQISLDSIKPGSTYFLVWWQTNYKSFWFFVFFLCIHSNFKTF